MKVEIIQGDVRAAIKTLPAESVHCVVTSPPYYGLRDYGVAGQIGLEPTPDEYIAELVAVFREVRPVLRTDGTLWLNLGDSYANDAKWGGASGGKHVSALHGNSGIGRGRKYTGAKPKDLLMIPARVALALRVDGWWLRSDIIWAKPNPMPESVTDRPTSSHEHVFLLAKAERYFFDADAARGVASWTRENNPDWQTQRDATNEQKGCDNRNAKSGGFTQWQPEQGRNIRNVWTIATSPYPEAHFATFPPELAERCIRAGCPRGGTVFDPFAGSGTTGLIANRNGRNSILIELNAGYVAMARKRIKGLTASVSVRSI